MIINKWVAVFLVGLLILAAGGFWTLGYAMASSASTQPLVYICQGSVGTAPACQDAQELQVSDHNGAPIFGVGEYGGAHVYGDNLSVNGTSVFSANVTESWESPVKYTGKVTCASPSGGALWIDSAGGGEFWTCTSGKWVRHAL